MVTEHLHPDRKHGDLTLGQTKNNITVNPLTTSVFPKLNKMSKLSFVFRVLKLYLKYSSTVYHILAASVNMRKLIEVLLFMSVIYNKFFLTVRPLLQTKSCFIDVSLQ